ncbi:MAG: zinc ribbon domain-containing protein [Elusimicrobia bacterium]|nr:zinc ribbon domain-containing protein [Elusimicrobiota bacterium]
MNRLKKAAVKIAVSCVGLWFIWQVISILPPIKNIQFPGGSGLSIDRVLETFFLTLIALALWFQSKNLAAELEAVFSKFPVLRLFWEDTRLFVVLFFFYRAYIDFLPLALGTGASFFSWCFFLILAFPIARIAWHGYHNLDLISDAATWTRLQNAVRLCAKCGSLNQAEAAYCRRCGAALTGGAPEKITRCVCGADVPACDSFCAKCGRPPIAGDPAVPAPPPKTINLTCPNCSAGISPGNQFCAKCGAKI